MLAAGYHQPTARSAEVNVESNGPSTRLLTSESAPDFTARHGVGFAKEKCENAPWIKVRLLIGLASSTAVSGRPVRENETRRAPKLCPISWMRRSESAAASLVISGPRPFWPITPARFFIS